MSRAYRLNENGAAAALRVVHVAFNGQKSLPLGRLWRRLGLLRQHFGAGEGCQGGAFQKITSWRLG